MSFKRKTQRTNIKRHVAEDKRAQRRLTREEVRALHEAIRHERTQAALASLREKYGNGAAQDAETQTRKWGYINRYTCEACGGEIVTIDIDEGTTPMFLKCRAIEGCDGMMASAMYRVDQNLTPGWEFYRPVGDVPEIYRQHVEMGGLMLRPIQAS